MGNALISIITPTVARPANIVRRCIESVRSQTFQEWEHIICTDGPFDQTISDLVASFNDPRLVYERTKERLGGYGAAVRGLVTKQWAHGRFLVFLDDDNILFPLYLERMHAALRTRLFQKRLDFAVCGIFHAGPVGSEAGEPPLYLKPGVFKVGHVDNLQIMIRREVMLEHGWNSNHYFADGETYAALAEKYRYVTVGDCLAAHL